MDNKHRAKAGKRALADYKKADPYAKKQQFVSDLLCDLMHHCGSEVDFDAALRVARMHYEAELNGEE